MKAIFFAALLMACSFLLKDSLQAQDLATIDGQAINKDEFLYAFNKNRKANEPINGDSLQAYLEQYINFKLKVRAARALGIDSTRVFQDELQTYISQIKKPYLENPKAEEELLKETYRRMQTDVNASHILLKIAPTAPPKDTLKAYNFLDSLRETIGSRIEFEEMARKYSQDGSAQAGGNLGWFTAMQMVAPFEDGAYNTPVGKISEVVRSDFGYHLIYVNDKRPNRGKIRTSHIFFTKQRGSEQALQKAQMVYDSLQNGGDWNDLARKYSDDNGSKADGGKLPWAGIKQLPDEFLDIAYTIEEIGQYTPPRETQFGWHIVMLNDYQPLEPYDIKKNEIAILLKRMGRNTLEEERLMAKLKKENAFQQNMDSLNSILNQISLSNKTDLFQTSLKDQVLFSHGNEEILVKDFLGSLPGFKVQYTRAQLTDFYQKFEKEHIIAYEDSIAPHKYPEYRFLMNEYEEGLLLFEIMQRKVWDKAALDSVGLENFYRTNLNKYEIGKRLECLCVNPASNDDIEKLSATSIPTDSLQYAERYIQEVFGQNKAGELKIAKRTLLASDLPNFEMVKPVMGEWVEPESIDAYCLIQGILPAGPQPLNEIKGIVMSDYQEYLDQIWIRELRNSAKIKINKKVLKSISNH